jgi:hypothetical protein
MPKIIKKRQAKTDVKAEDSVKSFMQSTYESLDENFSQIAKVAVAVLVVAALVAGYFIFKSSAERKAEEEFYEGYKKYHGLYDAKVLTPLERLEGALESFKESYEAGKSPRALLYMANCEYALGRPAEALSRLDDIERRYSGDEVYVPLALYKASVVHQKADKPEEALKALQRLYEHKSASYKDMALMESARVLEAMGRKDEAMEKYNVIVKDYPGSPFAEEARFKTEKEGEAEAPEPEKSESEVSEEGEGG